MNIEFKPFDTFFNEYNFEANPHIILIVNNEIKEAEYESGRNQFYIYTGLCDEEGTKHDYIPYNDSRITHWAYTNIEDNNE